MLLKQNSPAEIVGILHICFLFLLFKIIIVIIYYMKISLSIGASSGEDTVFLSRYAANSTNYCTLYEVDSQVVYKVTKYKI